VKAAADAFMPMLPPLLNGLASIGAAFAQLGIATAPGWQTFFDTFASTMTQLGPQIVGIGPALNTFLVGLSQAFSQLMAQVGPQLPQIFQGLADAFVALLPQIGPLVSMFLELIQSVGPQLPKFFGAVTSLIQEMLPFWPIIIGFVRNFVSALTWFLEAGGTVIGWFTKFLEGVRNVVTQIPQGLAGIGDAIGNFFAGLPGRALQAGKNLIGGLVDGITSGLGSVGGAAKDVVEAIAKWFQSSPAKVGPFSGSGYTMIRGQRMVTDMAAGMSSAQPAIEAAAASTAGAASGALSTAGGAPSPGGADTAGGALLPDNIAAADTGVLTAYLRHEFSDTNGLKGLAKDLGNMLKVAQDGFDLLNTHAVQPLFQALGMLPGAKAQGFRKMTHAEISAQQQDQLVKQAGGDGKKHSWTDVLGGTAGAGGGAAVPLGLSASSSKEDIQKAIIAAGRGRGMDDASIKTALAVADAESGFNPTISGGVQGSAGAVSGLFQQSPSSGWGTMDQVNDPNHAINAFYDAYAKQLAQNPDNPQLAAVLTQNPQLGSGAQGSDYWNAVGAKLGDANSILTAYGKGVTGPSWQQLTGSTAIPGMASLTAAAGGGGQEYGLPAGTNTGGYGTGTAATFPAWVMDMAAQFNVKPSTYAGHQETDRSAKEPAGYAPNPNHENRGIDWSGSVGDMQRFAEFLSANAPNMPGLEQIIWQNPETMQKIGLGGRGNPTTGYYPDTGDGSYQEHQNHVHTRQSSALLPTGPTPLSAQTGVGDSVASQALNAGLILPSGKSLDSLTDNTAKSATANDKLLQSYLQGNPALASQITAAQAPGASDATVMDSLTGINKNITDLKTQDPVGNKNTIDALQSQQSKIAQQQGFTQAPNGLQQAQSIAGGASGAITGVFQSIQSGLDALTATQDITDRLVYGVRNTEDVNKLIDDFQKYITFAADVVSTVGSIMSTAGSFTGGADFGGTSAAGSILSLISGVMQGVNAAIDFGQQVYELTMGYVGKFMSVLTGLGGGTDLMGNVGFLLNKSTGQLISYSQDNPAKQDVMNGSSFLNALYGYGGGNTNPQVSQQLNVYAGPGQSPAAMMNETMWLVNTQGTTGALAPANF
jgi:hypothetical protein